MEGKPNYYAVIPANVRYADISSSAKLMFGEITALASSRGYCWASNRYFADLYQVDADTVSRWIGELVDKCFVTSDVSPSDGNTRRLALSVKMPRPLRKKVETPIRKNAEHNNTSINNNTNVDKFPLETYRSVTDFFLEEYKRLWKVTVPPTVNYAAVNKILKGYFKRGYTIEQLKKIIRIYLSDNRYSDDSRRGSPSLTTILGEKVFNRLLSEAARR